MKRKVQKFSLCVGTLMRCHRLIVDILTSEHKVIPKVAEKTSILLQTLSLLPAGKSDTDFQWCARDLKSTLLSIAAKLQMQRFGGGGNFRKAFFVLPAVESSTNRISHSIRQSSSVNMFWTSWLSLLRIKLPKRSERSDTNIHSILFPLEVSEIDIGVLLRFTWYRFDITQNRQEILVVLRKIQSRVQSRGISVHPGICQQEHLHQALNMLTSLECVDMQNMLKILKSISCCFSASDLWWCWKRL